MHLKIFVDKKLICIQMQIAHTIFEKDILWPRINKVYKSITSLFQFSVIISKIHSVYYTVNEVYKNLQPFHKNIYPFMLFFSRYKLRATFTSRILAMMVNECLSSEFSKRKSYLDTYYFHIHL